jgi:hypothetical protein
MRVSIQETVLIKTALVLSVLLLLSALSAVYAGEGYPEFSWDLVPGKFCMNCN